MNRDNVLQQIRLKWICIAGVCLCTVPAWGVPNVELMLEQSPSDAGHVTPGTGVHRFIPNTQIEITAVPQQGYQFAYWLGDVTDPMSSTTQVRLNDSKAIIAVYEPMAPTPGDDDEIRRNGWGGGGGGGSGLRPSQADFFSMPFSAPGGSISGGQSITYQVIASEPIPEPATICLLGLGSLALMKQRKRRISST